MTLISTYNFTRIYVGEDRGIELKCTSGNRERRTIYVPSQMVVIWWWRPSKVVCAFWRMASAASSPWAQRAVIHSESDHTRTWITEELAIRVHDDQFVTINLPPFTNPSFYAKNKKYINSISEKPKMKISSSGLLLPTRKLLLLNIIS